MQQLYDPIRKKWVEKTPEEYIRQSLVHQMIDYLGYPRGLIAIEKELSQLPHLKCQPRQDIPKRRADIIVFAKATNNETLLPLLMIECKVMPLIPKFAQQVIGYNMFVNASFVAIANEQNILMGYFDHSSGIHRFSQGLPPYDILRKSLI